MTKHSIDATGLRCPQPILKIMLALPQIHPGDLLEATADCDTFEADVRRWCERMEKPLLAVTKVGALTTVQIQF